MGIDTDCYEKRCKVAACGPIGAADALRLEFCDFLFSFLFFCLFVLGMVLHKRLSITSRYMLVYPEATFLNYTGYVVLVQK